VPLSEEEQRILQEMEQKLYASDRGFSARTRPENPHLVARRATRWSVLIFVVGLAVLLVSFRSSIVLGVCGFLVMLFASIIFERSVRHVRGAKPPADQAGSAGRARPIGAEFSLIGKRLRSRFWRER
jgi:Protein of unknown function (DUF3040)